MGAFSLLGELVEVGVQVLEAFELIPALFGKGDETGNVGAVFPLEFLYEGDARIRLVDVGFAHGPRRAQPEQFLTAAFKWVE